ncbi:MAG: hypothetical protein ACFFDP_04150 [Promethearchaeota archaeon]
MSRALIAAFLLTILGSSVFFGFFEPRNLLLDSAHFILAGSWPIEAKYDLHIFVDSRGYIWVVNGTHLHKFTPTGVLLTIFPTYGVDSESGTWISDLAADSQGNIFAVDSLARTVKCFSPNGTLLTYWPYDNTSSAGLPSGIWIDTDDIVYVVDGLSNVSKYTLQGELVSRWGQRSAEPGGLYSANAVVTDVLDYVYIVDFIKGQIQKFLANGTFVAVLYEGNLIDQYQLDSWCGDLEIDTVGNLYLTDADHDMVYKLRPDGSLITIFGESGSDGVELFCPTGVAVDTFSAVYIAEAGKMRIQKFVPAIGGLFIQLIGAILITIFCAIIVIITKVYIQRQRQTIASTDS